jgi:hypothetical protein
VTGPAQTPCTDAANTVAVQYFQNHAFSLNSCKNRADIIDKILVQFLHMALCHCDVHMLISTFLCTLAAEMLLLNPCLTSGSPHKSPMSYRSGAHHSAATRIFGCFNLSLG